MLKFISGYHSRQVGRRLLAMCLRFDLDICLTIASDPVSLSALNDTLIEGEEWAEQDSNL
jgi:hypothetical protein